MATPEKKVGHIFELLGVSPLFWLSTPPGLSLFEGRRIPGGDLARDRTCVVCLQVPPPLHRRPSGVSMADGGGINSSVAIPASTYFFPLWPPPPSQTTAQHLQTRIVQQEGFFFNRIVNQRLCVFPQSLFFPPLKPTQGIILSRFFSMDRQVQLTKCIFCDFFEQKTGEDWGKK